MSRVRELLEEFALKLETELKRDLRAAIDGVGLDLGIAPARPSKARAARPARRNGAKRDPAAIEALAAKFVGFVTKHPGLRIEQINAKLGTSTKDLQLPIRKLLADRQISATGNKRSTTYAIAGKRGRKPKKK